MNNHIKLNHLRTLYFKLIKIRTIAINNKFQLRKEENEFIELIESGDLVNLNKYLKDQIDTKTYKNLLKDFNSNAMKYYKDKLIYLYTDIILFQNSEEEDKLISSVHIKALLKSTGKINSNVRNNIINSLIEENLQLVEDTLKTFNFSLLEDIYINKNQDLINLSKEYHLASGIWNERIKTEFELIEIIMILKKYQKNTYKKKAKNHKAKSSGIQLVLPI